MRSPGGQPGRRAVRQAQATVRGGAVSLPRKGVIMYAGVFGRENRQSPSGVTVRFVWLCLLVLAWAGGLPVTAEAAPSVTLTYVPPYGALESLRGQVAEVTTTDHKIAVYIQIPPYGWWSKPSSTARLTPIKADGTWECDITTVELDEYATKVIAFLVPAAYQPPLAESHQCLAQELYAYPYAEAARYRLERFANCDWQVRTAYDPIDPGPNYFSDSTDNVWVDARGGLHLKVARRGGVWYCSEVVAERSLGYGRYAFTVTSPVSGWDPNVVLRLYTWEDCRRAELGREMDVEISRWSKPSLPNTRFVVQPFYYEENVHTFDTDSTKDPNGTTTHEFTWEPDSISFQSYYGPFALNPPTASIISRWTYAGPNIPTPGKENIHISLWLANQLPPADGKDVEVCVNQMLFLPDEPNNVYRFWSPVSFRHFYTINQSEKETLERDYSSFWTYEGVVYETPAHADHPGLLPVHRFWSPTLGGHFYTINDGEKDNLIQNYPDVWTYEGPVFYAWPDGSQPPGSLAVHRFWSAQVGGHFYTASEAEKNNLIQQYPDVWTYEGVAWHAYALPTSQQ
jgi:hypothetical protein